MVRIILICLFGLTLQVYGATHREVMEQCRSKYPRESTTLENKKCFFACILKGIGVMNQDNTFNMDMEYNRIDVMFADSSATDKQKIKDIAKECSTQSFSGSECEIAAAYKECQKTKAREAGITIKPRGPPPSGQGRP